MLHLKPRKIKEIILKNGKRPFSNWLRKLKDRVARAKILQRINRAEEGDFGHYKYIDHCIFELKIDYGPGYRIYFALDGEEFIVLTWGGTKRTQQRDILKAIQLFENYKENKL